MATLIAFGNAAFASDLDIFLLSAVDRRFAPFYKRLSKYFDGSRDAMFSMVKESDVDRYFALAATFNGRSFDGGQRYAKRRCQFAAHPRNGVQSHDADGAAGRPRLDLSPGRDAESVRTEARGRADAPLRRRGPDASRIYQGEGPLPDRRPASHSIHDGAAAERDHALLRGGRLHPSTTRTSSSSRMAAASIPRGERWRFAPPSIRWGC